MAAIQTFNTSYYPVLVFEKSIKVGAITVYPMDNLVEVGDMVAKFLEDAYDRGRRIGAEEAKNEIRKALGV